MAINVNIRQASPNVGAFVEGVDLAKDMDTGTVSQLREALGAHGVLFFRDQNLTPDQHIAAAERFGQIDVNRFFAHVDGFEKIAEVRKEPEQKANIGGGWHTDHTYDQIPAMGSMLLARETPKLGGDTLFSSMFAAYDTLSDGLKATIEKLNAVHSSRHVFGKKARYKERGEDLGGRLMNPELAQQDAVHPVVIRHPISGKKAIYVNPGFTLRFEGMTDQESQPLLQTLYAHCQNQAFIYRFQWEPGSIAFWDNRATWHYAVNDYQGERRLMHRITIEGEAVAA
ncbi:MAG: TauD/TfdA family dioxygenase [Alphaproteobacteria bacterium]|jgi:taurine dioxygenase|nr:TauD/TfdA family dioxygenase [Alphaproteobacteria bacterium]